MSQCMDIDATSFFRALFHRLSFQQGRAVLRRSQRCGQQRSGAGLLLRECFPRALASWAFMLRAFKPRAFAVSLALGLSLTGCGEPDLSGLENKLGDLRADPSGLELPPVPDLPHYDTVDYDQSSRRSPFLARQPAPEAAPEGSIDLAPDSDRPLEPLEAYPLDKLSLVGTLSVGNRPSALVRAPGGEVHRLTNGDHMGTDYGRIVSITERAVQLVEVVNNGRGSWIEHTRQLTLDDPTTK